MEKKSIKAAKTSDDYQGMARAYNKLGVIYIQWAEALVDEHGRKDPRVRKKVDMAFEYLEAARKIFANLGLDSSVSMTLVNISHAEMVSGKKGTAIDRLSTAVSIVPKGSYAWFRAMRLQAEFDIANKSLDDAISIHEDMIEAILQGGSGFSELITTTLLLSKAMRDRRDTTEAMELLADTLETGIDTKRIRISIIIALTRVLVLVIVMPPYLIIVINKF